MKKHKLVDRLTKTVERKELEAINEIAVIPRLRHVVENNDGVRRFARTFHYIRYSFVHLNFIIGSRQEMHEILWSGLATNLYGEAGGGVTVAHNELYRRFLRTIGIRSDQDIEELNFSKIFNCLWRDFARSAAVEEAVLAVAIYEILDRPDYTALYKALTGVDETWDLEFFRIHSIAEHVGMFFEFLAWFFEHFDDAISRFDKVSNFVLKVQKDMWLGLLAELEIGRDFDDSLTAKPFF
jgi:hypothetical protein